MSDAELERLWSRIRELWIRRDKQRGVDSSVVYMFATNRAQQRTAGISSRKKVELCARLRCEIASLEEEVNLPVIYMPPPNKSSSQDVTKDALAVFAGGSTPVGNLYALISSRQVNWDLDTKDWRKAYVFACLSEIVYLHVGKYELQGKDRYKIIPSDILRLLLETNIRLDLARVVASSIDVPLTITDTNNFVFASYAFPQFTIVAIRGTTPTLQDIAIDLKEAMLEIRGKGYHMGFYNEAQRALLPLREAVKETDKPIYFTGHSLGGALSGLLAKMWRGPEKLMTPYTFGCPRFGNERTARSHPIHSFVRKFDPVPYLPPRAGGYCPAGWPPTLVPPNPNDKLLRRPSLLKLRVREHKIGGYRALIAKQVKTPQFSPELYYEVLKAMLLAR